MRDFVQASDFFASLKSTERVYLLVRHAERPHITAADADYGAHVGLTDAGRERAVALGKMFPPEGDAVYYSSPVGRCMDTAKCIAEGRALAGCCGESQVAGCGESQGTGCATVTPLAVLGHLYVKDYPSYLDVLNERFYQNICSWIDSDDHPAFYPLHERADIANRNKADVFISIHTNSVESRRAVSGMETYTMGMRRSDEKRERSATSPALPRSPTEPIATMSRTASRRAPDSVSRRIGRTSE